MKTDTVNAWQAEFDAHGSVTFGVDRRRAGLLAVAALALTVVGVKMMLEGPVSLIAGAAAVVFIGCLPVGLILLLRSGPTVTVDDSGIACGPRRVTWSEVIGVHRRGRGVVVGISSKVALRIRTELNPMQRLADRANQGLIGHPSMILPSINKFDSRALCIWLNQLLLIHQSD